MYKYTKKPSFVHSQLEFIPRYDYSKEKDTQKTDINRCGYAKPMQKRSSSVIKNQEANKEDSTAIEQVSNVVKVTDEIKNSKNTTGKHNYALPYMQRNGYLNTQKEESITKQQKKAKSNNNVSPKTQRVEELTKVKMMSSAATVQQQAANNVQVENETPSVSSPKQTVQQISQKLTEEIIMSDDLVTDEAQLQQTEAQANTLTNINTNTTDCDFTKLKEALQTAIINIDYAKIAVSFFLLLVNLLLLNPYLFVLLILALIVYVIYLICKYCACQNELKTNKIC